MTAALKYAAEPPPQRGAWYGQLYVQVLVAIALGVAARRISGPTSARR